MSEAPSSQDPVQEGLHAPHGAVLETFEPHRRWSPWRIAFQSAGFLLCVALFVWALRLAFSDDNRATLEQIGQSPLHLPVLLILLTCGSIVANGIAFWIVLLPFERLRLAEMIGVNAIATLMTGLPFKIGLIFRVIVHHRRDGVSFKRIFAWFGALTVMGAAVLGPLGIAGLWRGELDALWWGISIGGIVIGAVGVSLLGLAGGRIKRLHLLMLGADEILRDTRIIVWHLFVRLADMALLTGRFLLAAAIVDHTLAPDRAILFATTYFIIGSFAPTGSLGVREAGVAGIGWLGAQEQGALALVATLTLVVSFAEVAASAIISVPAAVQLRLDRLLLRQRGRNANGASQVRRG